MGCDIHVHVEVKIDGIWEHYAFPNVRRNYRLFAKMAGVRNSYDIDPISKPKGVPGDATKLTSLDYRDWGSDAHSASYMGLDEIKLLTEWLEKENWGESILSTSLEYTILNTYLFGNSFAGILKYPEDYERYGIQDARFIFWFDN